MALGTYLLSLEPGPQTGGVKNVIARQLLGGGSHLLPAYNADIVGRLQLLGSRVRIQRVHVVDGAARQDHVVERLLEVAYRVVHGTEREQRQRVDAHHYGDECQIQQHLQTKNEPRLSGSVRESGGANYFDQSHY